MIAGEGVGWYPIGAVARKTGLSVHTLRAWERRYGVVEPQRSAGGTRLYSTSDIARLRLLRQATEGGHAISQVAGLETEALRELLRSAARVEGAGGIEFGGEAEDAGRMVKRLLQTVELMDGEGMQSLLMRAVVALPVRGVVEEVLIPVLREVGERWAGGAICPANEHLFTMHVRRVLAWLTDSVPVERDAPTAVVTTPSGQWHEIGAQVAGVLASVSGWKVVYLGPNLPAEDIARAVELTEAEVVLLGVTLADGESVVAELASLRARLPEEVEVLVGGKGAEAEAARLEDAGVGLVRGYDELVERLRALGPAGWREG